MFGKTLARLTGSRNDAAGGLPAPPQSAGAPFGRLAKMLNASGRIGLPLLEKICRLVSKEDFIAIMPCPALVGSAIYSGRLTNQGKADREQLNRTILFEPEPAEADMNPGADSLKHAIYPLVKSEYAASNVKRFTLGRVDGNDMIMPDYAISKEHALIIHQRDSFLIKDCGSTNGTTVDGRRLSGKPVVLKTGSIVSFARYEFTFMAPGEIYDMLHKS
jgi:hypothetical protein